MEQWFDYAVAFCLAYLIGLLIFPVIYSIVGI